MKFLLLMIRLDFCHDARRQFGDLNACGCAFWKKDLECFGGGIHCVVCGLVHQLARMPEIRFHSW